MSYVEKFWRDATAADVARVMAGGKVEARFRDHAKGEWESSTLTGWQGHLPYKWIKATGSPYCECQVYAPPQWFLDRPEPGEGYRLLGKFPDEAVQGGDFMKRTGGDWHELANGCNPIQQEGIWYRRKIEPPKPETKYKVGQRVKIIGPPIKGEGPIYNWCVEMDKYIGVAEFVRSQPQQTFEGVFYQVSNIANWSFREEYLEPVAWDWEPEPKHYTLQVGDTAEFPDGAIVEALEEGVLIK